MTTKAAAARYLRDHLLQHAGKPSVVFNPKGLLLESLPAIYCFNNGGPPEFLLALAISADGVILGDYVCSHEGYMPYDLGVIEDSRPDRHEQSYQKHYPNGYRMEFVPSEDIDKHEGLLAAIKQAYENEKWRKPR